MYLFLKNKLYFYPWAAWFYGRPQEKLPRTKSILLMLISLFFIWYMVEIYRTFRLGYAYRQEARSVQMLENDYAKNQDKLIKARSADKIVNSALAQEMVNIGPLKYLSSASFFVEAADRRSP